MSREPSITVTGTGSAPAVPDIMAISFSVTSHHDQAAEAFARASANAGEVIDAVASADPAAELSTTGITLSARTTWRNEEAVLLGYDAETTIEATNLAVEAVAKVLLAAVGAGGDALRIHSLRAEISDPSGALETARARAFTDARTKAMHLALLAAARLGAVVTVRESAHEPAPPLPRAKAVALAASMPVLAGRQDLSVTLEVTWELRPGGREPEAVA